MFIYSGRGTRRKLEINIYRRKRICLRIARIIMLITSLPMQTIARMQTILLEMSSARIRARTALRTAIARRIISNDNVRIRIPCGYPYLHYRKNML